MRLFSLIVLLALIELVTPAHLCAAPAKHVLMVHSFGSAAPPFTVESMAFERALVQKIGERVDLDEVSLDMARYADADMQEAIVDYLQKRQAKWQPDLVVPIGAPASIFVATYRDRLFPNTPIIYATADRRLLPAGALDKNATYIGQIYDIEGMIDDMLQIAPATKNIVVVIGATPLEQVWKEVFRKAAEQVANRIAFTYFDDLSFDEMVQRSKTLPPNSFIFVLLLLRDAAGATHNADEALQQLHAVANAPINSIFDHQLGMGIVGGRLYQTERPPKEAADLAVRLLHGEPVSNFPPKMIPQLPPHYDWRELRRWHIDQKLLPPGSIIEFHEPDFWDRYKWLVLTTAAIIAAQMLIIVSLILNRQWRVRAEQELRQRREQVEVLSRVSLLGEMTASLAHELNQPLAAVVSNANAGIRMIDRNMIDATGTREIFTDVAADGRRAYEIIQNVRATIKKGGTLQTPMNVNDVVMSVTHMMHADAAVRGCQIETAVEKDLPLIKGDPTQLQQVIVNLVNNAFDAMRDTPPAERHVEIKTQRNDSDRICLSVRDHGNGITPDTRERLFERFFTTKEQGLGMGLSIVCSIVEAHGGRIEVENARDGGARFSITLPAIA